MGWMPRNSAGADAAFTAKERVMIEFGQCP